MITTLNAWLSLRAFFRASMTILAFAATTIPVGAATITVNSFNQIDPGQCTIATAIASVNAAADQAGCTHSGTYGTADTIVLAAGTYASTVIDNGANAYPIINVALIINGNGATLSRTVGAVAPFFRFFEVQAGGLTVNNATLTGGNTGGSRGGAIFVDAGPLTVSGSTFSGNAASGGDGGAIYHNSTEAASISNSSFSNNTALPSGDGGAVFDNSTAGLTLTNATFTGNTALDGGAVYDNSSSGLTVTNGTFTGNSAQGGQGGAIFDNSSGGLVFNGGTVANNNANPDGSGGGIYDNSSGGVRISNVSFTGNTTTAGQGGAIFDNSSVGTGPVTNNCFVGDNAAAGGGIFRVSGALNAINNWWGAASGPSGAGPGTGDAVSTNVTFAPFLTTAPAICGGGPPSPGTLQFSLANYSVSEGGGSATITVTRVGGTAGAVGVSFTTSNGTASAGSDYTTAAGALSWADGDAAPKTFTVTIIDDTVVEANETVNLSLSAPTGGATLGGQATAVLTIIDNDGVVAPVPTLSEWALWTMMLTLFLGGTWLARRRRP